MFAHIKNWLRLIAVCALAGLVIALGFVIPAAGMRDAIVARLASKLEQRFAAPQLSDHSPVTGIVVLGGGVARARAAVELARRHPEASVILSGPSRREERILETAPELAGRLIVDRRARTTFQNAAFSKQIAGSRPGERWIVVTSALHMPRSIGAFRGVGFAVEPWPVRDVAIKASMPSSAAQHELLGLVYYRLLGRTNTLLPRPDA
jgi:uncharacterized SAM-binding protein YcdF (DUF218 family)